MNNVDPHQYNLTTEDEARMKELLEEVRGRLEEMASIFCYTVGIKDRAMRL